MIGVFHKLKNRNGFTLFELIVVIAIIGILMMVFYPKLRNRTDAARIQAAESDIMKLYESAVVWKTNNGANSFSGVDLNVLVNAKVWDGHKSPFDTDYTITPNAADSNQSLTITFNVTGPTADSMCNAIVSRLTAKNYTAVCSNNLLSAVIG